MFSVSTSNSYRPLTNFRILAPLVALALIAATGFATAGERTQAYVVGDSDDTVWIGAGGFKDRAYLGVRLEEETDLEEGGARVTHVVDDSPADEAGVMEGDVIVEFDGKTILGPVALTEAIHSKKPGNSVSVTVIRDGRRESFDVEIGEWGSSFGRSFSVITPERFKGLGEGMEDLRDRLGNVFACDDDDCDFVLPYGVGECEGDDCSSSFSWSFFGGRPVLGVQLVEVTPELRKHLGADDENGILVSKVIEGSAAEDAGILVGDLITRVEGDDISNTRDLRQALHDKQGESFEVEVVRDGRRLTLDVTIPEPKRERPTGPRAYFVPAPDAPTAIAPRLHVSRVPSIRLVAPAAPSAPMAPRIAPSRPTAPSRPVRPARPSRPGLDVVLEETAARVLTSV